MQFKLVENMRDAESKDDSFVEVVVETSIPGGRNTYLSFQRESDEYVYSVTLAPHQVATLVSMLTIPPSPSILRY